MTEPENADELLDQVDVAGKVHLHKMGLLWSLVHGTTARCGTGECATIFFEELIRHDTEEISELAKIGQN